MLKFFIDRPVFSTVISIIIVVLGVLGITSLPITQYPDIAPPTVQVSATYTGADADVTLNSVIVPLEEEINGVEDMTYMTSTATNDGSASINVYFKVGTDPDMAAVNVQNRVSLASGQLPATVTQSGVTVRKRQNSNVLIFTLYSDNPAYDGTFLQNYAAINIIPRLQRVKGVGTVNAFGSKQFSMRIWLKPDLMASYGVTTDEIQAALDEQNVEAAVGKFGENSDQSFQYVIKYTGKLKSKTEFENIIIKSKGNGEFLRMKDVARVELGAQSYSNITKSAGNPAVGIAITQTAGSNARDVIRDSKAMIEEVAKDLPEGVHYSYLVDINKFLSASISNVLETLLEAFVLVFLIIFLFLQSFRSTLIPAISVPVAIIGTFFFLNLFGYSINMITLFALVLAIGMVVDDAIVVVEAVHAKLDEGYKSPRKASIDAMNEIATAIISITLVMVAVFLPVTFIGGSSGVFYEQFGITIAIAILISAVNALTLSPALAALFLRPGKHNTSEKKNLGQRFTIAFNTSYESLAGKYGRVVQFFSGKLKLVAGIVVLFIAGFFLLMKTTPRGFVPDEDMGTIFVSISLPPASSLERTYAITQQVDSIARTIPAVHNTMANTGQNFVAGSGSAYSMVILELKDWDERKGVSNTDVIAELQKKTASIKGAQIMCMPLPTISGFGINGGFEFQLQDKAGHTIGEFYEQAQKFLAELNKRPEIQFAATSFSPKFPQYQMTVDVAKTKDAGIGVDDILSAMQSYYGGSYASNFNLYGKQYRVLVQADTLYRANIEGLKKIYVKNDNGDMAPISSFITMKRVYGPENISRFNLFTSISVNGSPAAGYTSTDAINAIQEVADQTLPNGYGYEFSGITREETSSGSQAVYVFLLCLVFVYFFLSAQYESYLLPLAVILSLPIGLCGSFVFASLFGINNNIYMQISLIMLIGLLAKNAILIVEFAIQRRKHGMGIKESAIDAAKTRLRPILMTSLTFIFGIAPLLFSSGAGANGNKAIGASAIGGMLAGTLISILFIPALYIIFQSLQEKIRIKRVEELEE
ncbi:efflux RND transporter permease subunit [Mangrovibacterium diazotrophicum]|uniref:HAE1 family hydrophobic/amphiphilic exporter-1 n=1 Tax=Mangrovibacterium diazotrophicum TaxID=1261403 RepID=A0A419WAH0_9BACT|nr:efflux RND transporter permease subunit [Mangrovibacterium diazotrophicum]RKD92416.1 HAE1 family hydrophobic/amphiphilic exporter-1 [Mangrovibacterium diazotrophicum]